MNEIKKARTFVDATKSELTFEREGFIISEIRGTDNTIQITFFDIKDTKTIPFMVKFISFFKENNVPIKLSRDAVNFLRFFKQGEVCEGLTNE